MMAQLWHWKVWGTHHKRELVKKKILVFDYSKTTCKNFNKSFVIEQLKPGVLRHLKYICSETLPHQPPTSLPTHSDALGHSTFLVLFHTRE